MFIYLQEISFIRCIKPNIDQCSGIFTDDLVISQLLASCSIAYQKLMRIGFPTNMEISDVLDKFEKSLNYCESNYNRKTICSELIRSCGLRWKDFKLGNTKVFFRNGKIDVVSEKLEGDLQLIINQQKKLKKARSTWRFAIIISRLCSFRKHRRTQDIPLAVNARENLIDEVSPSININTDGARQKRSRKRKLDTRSGNKSCHSDSLQISGIFIKIYILQCFGFSFNQYTFFQVDYLKCQLVVSKLQFLRLLQMKIISEPYFSKSVKKYRN